MVVEYSNNYWSQWSQYNIDIKTAVTFFSGSLVPFEELTECQKLKREKDTKEIKEHINLQYSQNTNEEKEQMLIAMLYKKEVIIPKVVQKMLRRANRNLHL